MKLRLLALSLLLLGTLFAAPKPAAPRAQMVLPALGEEMPLA